MEQDCTFRQKNIKIDDAFCNLTNQFLFEENQPLVFQNINEKESDQNILIKKLAKHGFKSYLLKEISHNCKFKK